MVDIPLGFAKIAPGKGKRQPAPEVREQEIVDLTPFAYLLEYGKQLPIGSKFPMYFRQIVEQRHAIIFCFLCVFPMWTVDVPYGRAYNQEDGRETYTRGNNERTRVFEVCG